MTIRGTRRVVGSRVRVRRRALLGARSRLAALARAQSAHQRRSVARPSATTTRAKAATTTPTNSHELSRSCGRNGSAIGGRDGRLGRCAASPLNVSPVRSAAKMRSRRGWRRGDIYVIPLPQKRPRAAYGRSRTTRHRQRPRRSTRAPSSPLARPAPAADAGPTFNPGDDVNDHGAGSRADTDVSDRPDRPARRRRARAPASLAPASLAVSIETRRAGIAAVARASAVASHGPASPPTLRTSPAIVVLVVGG